MLRLEKQKKDLKIFSKNRASRSKSGQAISEYLILLALIAVGSIAVIQVLSVNIRTRLAVISEALRGVKSNLKGSETPETVYRVQDLSNFQEGMQEGGGK